MIKWLQNYSGTGTHGVNIERAELQNLRKEIKHYKKKYEKEDKEIIIVSDNEEKENKEDQEIIDEEIRKKQQKRKNKPEVISDEVLFEKDILKLQNYSPYSEEKSQEIYEKIRNKCESLFFFNNLSENELNSIISAFKTEKFKKDDPMTYIKTYKEGDSFGELALMYNYKRNYTIKAKTSAVLFSLDRQDYKGIIQGTELNQREKYKTALKNIDILQNLTPNEIGKVCDIMVEKEFKAGEEIIKQNENEDEFIILYEGNCHSEKISDSGKAPQMLKEFESYDYFGEAPWFKSEQRNYIVIADSDCTVFVISRKEFKRMVGSLENILKRKIESYQKFMKK